MQKDTQQLHTSDMIMLRWARGKTKKGHIKNEDVWREANIEPELHWTNANLRQIPKYDSNCVCAGKEKKGRPNKLWLDNTREHMKEYNMADEMAENRSVWHVNRFFLHGGGL